MVRQVGGGMRKRTKGRRREMEGKRWKARDGRQEMEGKRWKARDGRQEMEGKRWKARRSELTFEVGQEHLVRPLPGYCHCVVPRIALAAVVLRRYGHQAEVPAVIEKINLKIRFLLFLFLFEILIIGTSNDFNSLKVLVCI